MAGNWPMLIMLCDQLYWKYGLTVQKKQHATFAFCSLSLFQIIPVSSPKLYYSMMSAV